MIAQVIVDIVHSRLDRVYDYAVPEGMEVLRGCRVGVPFGAREVEGIVVDLAQSTDVPPDKLRPIRRLLDQQPALPEELIELAQELTRTTHCLMAEALQVMLPAEMRGGRVKERTVRMVRLCVSPEEAQAMAARVSSRAPLQAAVLRSLVEAEDHRLPTASLKQANSAIRRLTELGITSIEEEETLRRPRIGSTQRGDFALNFDQQKAIARIDAAMNRPEGESFLLHGVTGSGKTEVYMAAAEKALDAGKSVIMLVPEIALTPQMVAQFVARFGDLAAVMHSRLSPGERYDEWRRIRKGKARVVVGARSAIFAPVQSLGLVIVDEEHELSYRSEHSPRYDAIRVAEWRRAYHGAVLVMGSATPTIRRYHAAQMGQLQLLQLPGRVNDLPMPEVSVVDMRTEIREGNRSPLSRELTDRLAQCVQRGDQAILFLNRRGYSTFVSCRACGYVCTCEFCDIAMTYHSSGERLVCHYCGREERLPKQCPSCGSPYIRYFGGGTERLEQTLLQQFPGIRVIRMDADTTRGKDGHLNLFESFRRGEAQVLVGTQMVAKGLDFPNVTLVGVVAADQSLHMPDWRAAERTFQLIEQVAGRAGRSRAGEVVVQTYSPEHYAVQLACNHDYARFFREEVKLRRITQFAPFAELIRVMITHEDEDSLMVDLVELEQCFQRVLREHPSLRTAILLHQSGRASIQRIRGIYRAGLLIKTVPETAEKMEMALAAILPRCMGRGSTVVLESDPLGML